MARPLRVEYPGALYHVMNRGNQREDIFRSPLDCETFLEKLDMFCDSYRVEIHSYCLMSNHFHLLLRTREANLSKFMQAFLTSFTVTINRRNRRTGHLFHGRFKGHLVESRKYLSVLSRYIHLNPVRIKEVKKLPVQERKRLLDSFQWLSYRACVGLAEQLPFLEIESVLSSWGKRRDKQIKEYRKYVEEGLYKGVENPFDLAIRGQIIGSETFAEEIARSHLLKRSVKNHHVQRELLKARQVISPEEVIRLSAEAFATTREKVITRKGKHRQARKTAMFLCCKHCVSKHSLTSIAQMFSVTIGGLTKMRDVMSNKMEKQIREKISEIEKKMAGQ